MYILIKNGEAVNVSDTYPAECEKDPSNWLGNGSNLDGWAGRWDITSFDQVKLYAEQLTKKLGETFLPCDAGEYVSPQFSVIRAPKIGDKVSSSFNGDSYPCGEIVKITPTWRITTSTGKKFSRCKQSAGWREVGRGFWLVHGHISERNPHF